jgi:hypothetical protein
MISLHQVREIRMNPCSSIGHSILLIGLLVTGCRQAPPAQQSDSASPTPRDSSAGMEVYAFLNQPGVAVEDVDSLRARIPYDSIFIRRDPCFGSCPMYEATLYRDGRARYSGTRFVENVGDYRGEVQLQDYGRLSYLLDKLGFMTLPDSFSVPYTDLPGATLAVSRGKTTKSVHDYGYTGPVELWTLMEVFDRILDRIPWEKTSP